MKPSNPSETGRRSSGRGNCFCSIGNDPMWCVLLSFYLALVAGAASAEEPSQANVASPAQSAPTAHGLGAPPFKSELDKLSYALGVNAATQLKKFSLEVDPEMYSQGLKAALTGSGLRLSATEASALVGEKQKELTNQQQAGKTNVAKQSAAQNKTAGEAFLAGNKTKAGVVTLPSGLQYKILKAGDGRKPSLNDTIICHYLGTLVDGTEFDSTAKRGKPGTFPAQKVIKGWREVLPLMPVGSKWQVVVPPELAYGARGTGRIVGPNATLIFELELLDTKQKVTSQQKP